MNLISTRDAQGGGEREEGAPSELNPLFLRFKRELYAVLAASFTSRRATCLGVGGVGG